MVVVLAATAEEMTCADGDETGSGGENAAGVVAVAAGVAVVVAAAGVAVVAAAVDVAAAKVGHANGAGTDEIAAPWTAAVGEAIAVKPSAAEDVVAGDAVADCSHCCTERRAR